MNKDVKSMNTRDAVNAVAKAAVALAHAGYTHANADVRD